MTNSSTLENDAQAATKSVGYYLSLPYTVEITPISEDEGGGYNACIPRIGRYTAVGDGDTPEEAYADLRAALPSLIEYLQRQGVAIPESVPIGNGRHGA